MLKKSLLISCTLAALPSVSQADTILGLYLGASHWQTGLSGSLNEQGNASSDVEDDFGIDDEGNNFIYAALEHPIPLVPNIKLQQTSLDAAGSNGSNVDFSHTDATLYYEILDNWVSLDIGLTARTFNGAVTFPSSTDELELSATMPMLYAKAQFDLPFTGLSAGVEGNLIGYSGNNLKDLNARINYEAFMGLGIAVGYRVFTLELDDIDDLNSDLTLDGFYAGLTYHF
jgi:outer membrane protein